MLLTGFAPFDGAEANPSADAVRLVARDWTDRADRADRAKLVTAVLPVSFARAAEELAALIAEHDPDVVVATGLAGGRAAVSVERVAVNLVDARIPDADGVQPVDVPSLPGAGPAAFSSLPVKAIVRAIGDAGIPAELSMTAGGYVCNHVFMHAAAWAAASGRRAGFILVPWRTGQAPSGGVASPGTPEPPELPVETIAAALRIAIRTSLDVSEDLHHPAGTIA